MRRQSADFAGARSLAGRLALVAAAVAVTVVVLEGLVRLLHLGEDPSVRSDPRFGWSHIPGARGSYASSTARAPFRINSRGLMGPEHPYEKPAGGRRVLLLGDSFTESMQVPYEKSWAYLMERELGPGWEVLNAGVRGYGTDNELLFLREEGFRYNPDVVVLLFFTGNDVSDNDHALSDRIGESAPKPYFTLSGDSLTLHPLPASPPSRGAVPFLKGALKHSALYRLVRDRLYQARALRHQLSETGGEVPLTWQVYRRAPDSEWERAWAVTAALLGRIRREAAARNVAFGVGVLPTGWRIDGEERRGVFRKYPALADTAAWDLDGPDDRLAAILAARGIPHVLLAGPLEATSRREGVRLYGDHLSVRGHQVVAAAMADLVRDLVAHRRADESKHPAGAAAGR